MFDSLSDKFHDAFKNIRGKGKISEANIEETLKEVRTALLEADVNFKVVRDFVAKVKEESLGEKVIRGVNPGEQFVKIMHDQLAAIMGSEHEMIDLKRPPVIPMIIVGLNGSGKTTFTGKFAKYLKEKEKKDVYIVPADNFRPAAKDQLLKLASQVGVDYSDSDLSLSPREIALRGMQEAQMKGKEIALIDTAGRLHVDQELMAQLKDLKKALDPMKPEVLFVADAMTGQEAVNVAKTFHEEIGLTGVILSKMDSDARGGAALSIKYVTGVPIRFISTGEKVKDLERFHPDRLASRILDMGDVLTLVEKAQENIDEKEAEAMMKKMEKNKFSIDDFYKQMNMMSKLGSFEGILKMIPGMGGLMRQIGDLSPAEDEMKRIKVMIQSMTKKERDDCDLLKSQSRISRIAKGSGTDESKVRDFIKKFEQMRQMLGPMMQMMKGGGMGGFPGMPGMPGMGGGNPGFRQAPGMSGKMKKKGKNGRSPFGKKYF